MEIKSVKEFDKEKYYNFAVSISDGMHGWSLTKKESKLLSIHMKMGSDFSILHCKEAIPQRGSIQSQRNIMYGLETKGILIRKTSIPLVFTTCKELSHWSDGVIKINIQVSCKEEH